MNRVSLIRIAQLEGSCANRRALVIVSILILFGSPSVSALPVLDQSFEFDDGSISAAVIGDRTVGSWERAQTFTIGLAGTLSRVEAKVARDAGAGDLQVSILPIYFTGAPIDLLLATASAPATAISDQMAWVAFDVSAFGVEVVPGDRLAIAMTTASPATTSYRWKAYSTSNGVDPYPAGETWYRNSDVRTWTRGESTPSGKVDVLFRTFVIPVPEPSCVVLISFTLGGYCYIVWRRRLDS